MRTTYPEFVNDYLVKNTNIAYASVLNKPHDQLKKEIDETSESLAGLWFTTVSDIPSGKPVMLNSDGTIQRYLGTLGAGQTVIGVSKLSTIIGEQNLISVLGTINNLTGLTIGSKYFADTYGDLVNYNTNFIEIGKAISTTELLITIKGA